MKPGAILVCFAVSAEAGPFRRDCPEHVSVVVTGMGAANARRGLERAVEWRLPDLVLTCGFAGGLEPRWPRGTVLFEADDSDAGARPWVERLQGAGARPGRIHCASRVAVTVAEKERLRSETGADAVEMESGVIRSRCRELGLPAITVRAISDAAGEPLPVDFNAVMGPDHRLDPWRLAGVLLRSPGTLGGLLRLQRHCVDAAARLAEVLHRALGVGG